MSTLRHLFILLLLCGTLSAAPDAADSASRPAGRPNFVVVLIDDMGWGDLSCFGNREARTPNIDRLATEGVRFSRFYVNSPICSPSRCALTTGQYPQRWRITSYLNNHADNERRGMADWLDPAAPTFAGLLHAHGYATGHFGKWHLGGQRDVSGAPAITAYGFDESLTNFEGMGPKLLPLTLQPGDKEPGRIWADAERLGGPFTWTQRAEITGGFVSAAVRFADAAAAAGKPFCINVWPDDVHTPLWPPVTDWREGKRAKYLAVLENMDRQLGVLFSRIREDARMRQNTVILLCSDNGHEPGAGSPGPHRGCKGTLYEGGIRSPLIVWAPGLTPTEKAGYHNDCSVVAAIDIAPSLLAMAGVAAPASAAFDGADQTATLLGKSAAVRSGPLFWRRPPDRKKMPGYPDENLPDLALIEGEWKLLCSYDGSRPQLYRLTTDPAEATSVAEQNAEVVARLTKSVVAWHASLLPDNGPALGGKK